MFPDQMHLPRGLQLKVNCHMPAYQVVKVDHPLLDFVVDGGRAVLDLPPAHQDHFGELAAVAEVLEQLLPGLAGGAQQQCCHARHVTYLGLALSLL